jgi:putative spermidine/putrescine transport system permease protein
MNEADTAHPMGLALPLALFFAAFFAIPLLLLLWVSLQGGGSVGLEQYIRFFADGLGIRVLLQTLRIGLETTLGCLLLAYPLALIYRSAPGWGRSAITLIVLLPLLTSVVVRGKAWSTASCNRWG